MSVTVYRVQGDLSSYSIVDCGLMFPQNLSILRPFLDFRAMSEEWKTLACKKVGDNPLGTFAGFSLVGGMPVVFPEVLTKSDVAGFLKVAGELLPITVDGRNAFALNVTRTVNACDRDKSRMHQLADGQPATNWPVFKGSVVSEITGLFRIKEVQSWLYLAEPGDGTGLYAVYKKHGLSGLVFEEQPVS